MKLQKSFKLALNILLHSKIRSWLTIIGIVIGVAAIVAIISIGQGAQASVKSRLGGLGADIVTVNTGFQRASGGGFGGGGGGERSTIVTQNLTTKDIQTLKSVQGISVINGVASGRATVTYLTESTTNNIQGVDPTSWKDITTDTIASGRFLNSGDTNVVVLGNRVATTTFKEQIVVNRDILINNKPYKVVGVLAASGGFGGSDNAIFIPIDNARVLLNYTSNYYSTITFKVADVNAVNAVVNETTAKLMVSRNRLGKTPDFSVTSAAATQASIASITSTFTIFLAAIAAVSLLVGAVGIANTMFTSVLEKTKEIGIMKAIGARNFDIMMIFLLNSALVGLVGGIIGVSLGAGISALLPGLIGRGILPGGSLTTVIPLTLIVEAIVISVMIGMIAGAIPAYRASKLKPVDALRYE
jgi:putative ABC transport system permease protein